MAKWNNGLFDCCGEPGGASLCLLTYCCPCLTAGDISEFLNPGSKTSTAAIWWLLAAF
eukprot:CAMPEP_0194479694 /NCGR_PEP_ID=MMETSP0253-20130528/2734_1 /TAXON_ID=2966 /ORGANISM="Noctiluca scintillans" /LENGTH=57 /DNA_ID=CAMNT_0039318961 /DNA_START=67 /DNA_END=237 /DNA_ORIENTATION=+